jgi:tRNA(fMet)-specific endonuclease VapC
MILLDTNICIYIINGVLQVQERSKRYKPTDIYISAISVAELMYGAAKSKYPEETRDKIYTFISKINIIDFGATDAIQYGNIRAHLAQRGELIGALDMLIAAQAVANGFRLITNNIREFQRVPNIILENWA